MLVAGRDQQLVRTHMSHIVWADNIYLLESKRDRLLKMIRALTDRLEEKQLRWEDGSLKVLDCGAEEFGAHEKAWRFKSAKGTWYEIEIVETMEAPGAMLDRRMSTEAALNHRWRKAKGSFMRDIKYYTTPGMPYIRKFEKYVAK